MIVPSRTFKKYRFIGVSLSGGKTPRTHVAVIDFFPSEKKVFLTHLFRDIGEMNGLTADTVLIDLIKSHKEDVQSISIDAPLTMPKCIRCRLVCPGAEACTQPEIKWMWQHHKAMDRKKNPNKIFTPYTERCVESYLSTQLEQNFPVDHTLGSNRAPLWARTFFLQKRLKSFKLLEVMPRINTWRIGRELKISKTPLMFYKNSVEGSHHRQTILDRFVDAEWLFIYLQDVKHMVKDVYVFESVMSAFTGLLQYKNLCEKPPKNFPLTEGWVAMPKSSFSQHL